MTEVTPSGITNSFCVSIISGQFHQTMIHFYVTTRSLFLFPLSSLLFVARSPFFPPFFGTPTSFLILRTPLCQLVRLHHLPESADQHSGKSAHFRNISCWRRTQGLQQHSHKATRRSSSDGAAFWLCLSWTVGRSDFYKYEGCQSVEARLAC